MRFSNKVVYQIYPKSFKDSNNDGLGDIQGIISKLDYLEYLGVDYIWLTPIFKSPQNDNGYDVSDYFGIEDMYGSMKDVEQLIAEAKKHNIGIMFDMVLNHTSTEHIWFKKALQNDPKYHDFYIFKKGNKDNPPTNWESKFGGNAWEYVEELGEFYLHLFDKTQADLNWNNPEVREEIKKIVLFWMEKGIKGFRFDVVNLISKPDEYLDDNTGDGRKYYTDGKHVHEFIKELNEATFGKDVDIITVGEMSSTTLDNCIKYANEDSHELSMTFNFHHLKVDYKNKNKWELKLFDFNELKSLLNTWQIGMQEGNAWNALFWCNHDQPRAVSRFGNDKQYWYESATMLATTIHMMRGTPYIYQGEEIGMTNAYFEDISLYKDVESLNYFEILKNAGKSETEIYHILNERSRDNARTPMQWNAKENAGFSEHIPWLSVIDNYKDINVESQVGQEKSILEYYRKLIKLRKDNKVICEGIYEPLFEKDNNILAYKRILEDEEIIVLNNFYGKQVELPSNLEYENIILNNYETFDNKHLNPYQSVVLKVK